MRDPLTDISDPAPLGRDHDDRVAETVESNALALRQLLDQVADLRDVMVAHLHPAAPAASDAPADAELQAENEQLRQRILELEDHVYELQRQNGDLASQVASSTVRESVADSAAGSNEAMSWEDRKKMILQQMEDDSFDADQFVSSLQEEASCENTTELNPSEFVEHLHAELESRNSELQNREEEIRELRCLLDHQSETREGNVAIGAAAVAELIDADELIQQERLRLQELQAQWEEKFRQGEIEASLERAKLSRERQELATKSAELEEQLERLKRESNNGDADNTPPKRRWLAKLGLNEE